MLPLVALGGLSMAALFLSGCEGSSGPKGNPGSTGNTGPQGPEGPRGFTGDRGPDGPQGPQGIQGPQGPQGPKGPAGSGINWGACYFKRSDALISNLKSSKGFSILTCEQNEFLINGGCEFVGWGQPLVLNYISSPCSSKIFNNAEGGVTCNGIPDSESFQRVWYCGTREYIKDIDSSLNVIAYGTCCPK